MSEPFEIKIKPSCPLFREKSDPIVQTVLRIAEAGARFDRKLKAALAREAMRRLDREMGGDK